MSKKIIGIILLIFLMISVMSISLVGLAEDEEYYIQIGAFKIEKNAEKKATVAKLAGYDSVVIKIHNYHKVFLGPYSTSERAREIQVSYLGGGGTGFFIVKSEMYNVVEPIIKKDKPKTEEIIEEVVEEEVVEEEVIDTEEQIEDIAELDSNDNKDYLKFTVVFISVLWIIFITIGIVIRLNKNKK